MMNPEMAIDGKSKVGLTIYATLCASIVAVLLLTNWPTYHFAIRGGPIPLVYFVLPGLFIIPVIFAEPASLVRFLKDPLFWWFVIYTFTGAIWLLVSQDFIDDANRMWRLRVLELYFFFTITLLVSDARRRFLAFVIVGCVLLAIAGNWVDVMRPGRFIPEGIEGGHPGRGAGTFVNPNAAATFIVMGTIATLPFVPMRFRGMLLVAALVGVAPTLSRSGFLLVAVAFLGAMVLGLLNRMQSVIVLVAIPLLVAATSVYYDTLIVSSDAINLDSNVNRLRWFEGEEDGSSIERRSVAAKTRDMFLEEPLIGHGIGATRLPEMGAGPHNMYLTLMAEQGITGFALYVSLIVVMYRRGRRLAKQAATREGQDIGNAMAVYALFLAAYGWFSHNVLEEAPGAFIIAFLAAIAYRSVRTEYAAQYVRQAPPRPKWRTPAPAAQAADRPGLAVAQQRKDAHEPT